jgi:hypothetical protein
MGTVYEVEHTVTGERLALKVLWSSANPSPEALTRFKHEARASALLKSENVVRVTDADVALELGNAPFLVMELLEGTDLERAAAPAPPAPATVVEWLRQVANVVDKAHGLGIIHRDLKPENLFLVTAGGRPPIVKVLDFGIVKMHEEGTGATGSGQILGTPRYMAPEQVSPNAEVTPATDRCALGLIAYRLLIGESYYQGGVMIILGQLLHSQLEPPSKRGSRFGLAFDAWFLKACHRDPEQRFGSASGQIEALAEALGLPRIAVEGTPAETTKRSWISHSAAKAARRAALAVTALAAVSVVAVGAWPLFGKSKVDAPVCGLPSRGTTAACGTCMAQACCTQAQECSETEGCPQVERCVRGCASGDAVCRDKCYSAKGLVAQFQQSVETCRAQHCAAECLPGPWACLGKVKWRFSSVTPPSIVIKTTVACVSCGPAGAPAPLAGTTVRVCSLAERNCDFPLASGVADGNGAVTLSVDTSLHPPPLAVFLDYRKDGFADTLLQLDTPPVTGDLDVGRTFLNDPKVNLASGAASLGTTYDPTRGQVGVIPTDCNGQPATKKIALTWLDRDDHTTAQAYSAYGGEALATNLPLNKAGITRMVARVAETGQLVATNNVVVRPGAVTFLWAAPTP